MGTDSPRLKVINMKNETLKKPLIVIAGPTASGKTGLAIALAKRFSSEVISADSMQIYKYMDIGTAKPDEKERDGIKHHMIDVVYPNEPFSVFDYARKAREIIADCHSRGVVPIMAGGTGLYINNIIYNINLSEESGDKNIREELEARLAKEGIEKLYAELEKIDPKACEKIHINNTKRVIRALEIFYSTGKTMTEQNELSRQAESDLDVLMMIPNHEREVLYERINKRVDIMFESGLENEVKSLIEMGYSRDLNSMQAIGYKEMFSYFAGECSIGEATELIKQNTRRYAKRQLTWFRRNEEAIYLEGDMKEKAIALAEEFLS